MIYKMLCESVHIAKFLFFSFSCMHSRHFCTPYSSAVLDNTDWGRRNLFFFVFSVPNITHVWFFCFWAVGVVEFAFGEFVFKFFINFCRSRSGFYSFFCSSGSFRMISGFVVIQWGIRVKNFLRILRNWICRSNS